MKKAAWVVALATVAVAVPVTFKLFEPVFVYRAGWAAMPDTTATVSDGAPDWKAQGEKATAALTTGRATMGAPAVSAAVSIDGQVVWRGVSGLADVEAGTPAAFDTRFRLGSTSKAVTAVAVGTLIDNGLIDIAKPIQTYVPHYPQQKWPMTVAQVMSHRAGIRDYGMCFCFPVWEHQNTRHFNDLNDEVSIVANAPLLFKPGTDFKYTSLGYNLAGAAIEGASDTGYDIYLNEAVFKPLRMDHSGLDSMPGAEVNISGFYETEDGQYKRAFPVDNSIRWPSGGVLSTPSDMVKLGQAMLDDRLLTARTRTLLVTVPDALPSGGAKAYALGWRRGEWTLHDGKVKLDSYHHAGTAVGATSVFVVFPEKRMVVSVMINKGGQSANDLSALTDKIIEAFIPAP
jgi:serine beta-lactamase-like protein LACTB, mitochondrial